MPTFAWTARFGADFRRLTSAEQVAFPAGVSQFLADLRTGGEFRAGLRVKGVQGARGVFEMTWAADGRATFQYGPERTPGQAHVIWRRVGAHAVFDRP